MKVSINDVEYIAALARLRFSDADKQAYAEQMSQILAHAGKIAELDTDTALPTAHAVSLADVYREDEVRSCAGNREALRNAPVAENGYFRVPKIV